jgi:hypothetical protein
VVRKVSVSTIERLLILAKIEQFYRSETPSVLPSVVHSHQAFKKERAHELAVSTTILKSQGIGNLGRALAALSRSEQFDETTDYYLLELRRQLLDAQEVEQAQVISALNNALRRRSSGVTELGVWRGLALPEKLLDLMATSRS